MAESGSETVLVVDDEEMILFVASSSLEMAGFEVLTAGNGFQALEVFERHHDRIAAILLDMSMPRLDGIDTFHRLRRVRSDVPVIFTSGYTEEESLGSLIADSRVGFLQKPYLPRDLTREVRRILGT